MAHATLPVISHPEFPQVFDGVLDRLIQAADRACAGASKPALDTCQFEDEGWPCYHPAVVHHLASEQEFCRFHFRKVCRG